MANETICAETGNYGNAWQVGIKFWHRSLFPVSRAVIRKVDLHSYLSHDNKYSVGLTLSGISYSIIAQTCAKWSVTA